MLVGERLMADPDIGHAVDALLGKEQAKVPEQSQRSAASGRRKSQRPSAAGDQTLPVRPTPGRQRICSSTVVYLRDLEREFSRSRCHTSRYDVRKSRLAPPCKTVFRRVPYF